MIFKKNRIFPRYITPLKLVSYFLVAIALLLCLLAMFGNVPVNHPEILILILVVAVLLFMLDRLLIKRFKNITTLLVWELIIAIAVLTTWLYLTN